MFLASIGMMILLNLGTNYFMGEISYITKALSAVLLVRSEEVEVSKNTAIMVAFPALKAS